MKILIIEDERKTGLYLKKGLSENGFIIDLVADGQDGILTALTNHYDLIISDIMLPRKDGWAVLSTLREKGIKTPLLFLTAKGAVADRVKGLESGAEDYLIKPFAFSELLARIRNILRRGLSEPVNTIKIADLEIDTSSHKAFRNGERLDLTSQEFALLSLLARREGQVVSRTIIAEQIWNMSFDSNSNVVDVAIGRLRRKVDDAAAHKLIHTIRGIGYVLENHQYHTVE